MKLIKYLIILFFGIILLGGICSALKNPAAVYCKELGYNYEIKKISAGEQGLCITPDGAKLDEWNFLRGKVGKAYSYCAQQGYDTKTGNGQAICVPKKNLASRDRTNLLNNKEIPMTKMMGLDEKLSESSITKISDVYSARPEVLSVSQDIESVSSSLEVGSEYSTSNFSYWDWRDPPNGTKYSKANFTFFDNVSRGWMTSVKNQGSCGSCWAFSTVGAVEAKYNINQNNSRLNPDLSEQNLVSCDNSYYDISNNNSYQGGCSGGYFGLALDFIKTNGISDENCFPYTAEDSLCSGKCSDSNERLWNISGGNYPGVYSDFTNDELQQGIIDYGALSVSLYMTDNIDEEGFLDCSPINTSNHAVVLMGYNNTGNDSTSYWIIKNSWGTTGLGVNGYFKVRYDMNCNIGDNVQYVDTVNPPNFKPSINLNSPLQNYFTKINQTTFNFTINNKNSTSSSYDLTINSHLNRTNNSVINGTSNSFILNLLEGIYYWNIIFWENNFGIVNTSETRTFTVDTTAPNVSLISPSNNKITPIKNQTFICNVVDTFGLKNITFYLWNSSKDIINQTNFNISGTENQTEINILNLSYNTYYWNCFSYDNVGNSDFATSNYTLTIGGIFVNLISPSDNIYTNVNETNFSCNLSSEEIYELSNVTFYLWNSSALVKNETKNISGITNATTFNFTFTEEEDYSWNCLTVNNDSYNSSAENNFSITFDVTNPIINLSEVATGTSTTIVFSFNVSDLNPVSNCSVYIDNVGTLNTNIINNSGANLISVSGLSAIAHNAYVNCSDGTGNTGNSSTISFIINSPPVVPTSSGGGGGGGSSVSVSSAPKIYEVAVIEAAKGHTQSLKKDEKISFSIFDFEGGQHLLTINEVGGDYVNLTIESEPINLKLGVGQSAKLNLTSADYYDLFVKLEEIAEDSAKLTIQLISEPIEAKVVEVVKEEFVETEVLVIKDYFWVVVVLIIILASVVFVVIKLNRKKLKTSKRKKRKKKHGKNKKT